MINICCTATDDAPRSFLLMLVAGFYPLGGGGGFPPKVFLKKNVKLFQIKIFFDDDFKESVKITNVQKCDFSQS